MSNLESQMAIESTSLAPAVQPAAQSAIHYPPSPGPLVFTNGCFDLFHAGHAAFLQACRRLGSRLVIGLNSDASVRALKGTARPVCSQVERQSVLEACRFVDEVIVFDESTPCELIRRLRPDIIVKGPGYSEANMPEAAIVNEYGGRIVILDGPLISTTDLIARIRQRYSVGRSADFADSADLENRQSSLHAPREESRTHDIEMALPRRSLKSVKSAQSADGRNECPN